MVLTADSDPADRKVNGRVWLTITNSVTDPNIISRILGLESTRILEAGKPMPPLANGLHVRHTMAFNRWEMQVLPEETTDVHACLRTILNLLTTGARESLRALSKEADVRVEVEITDQHTELHVPPELISALAECGGGFDLEISD